MIRHRPQVLGVQVTPGTHQEILKTIREHIISGENLMHVATANPEYVMTARRDPGFAGAINSSEVITVDGVGLAFAMRLLHPGIPMERYTGVTLSVDMAELSAATGARVYLLGAGPGVADAAAAKLQDKFPGSHIVGTWADGSPRPEHDSETLRRIRESNADIVLVAYGAPAQIYWIQRNLNDLDAGGVKMVAGIGGAIDYISGTTQLPPELIRRFGLEWLYRLVREPWRWRRQLVLPHFAVLVLATFIRSKLQRNVE